MFARTKVETRSSNAMGKLLSEKQLLAQKQESKPKSYEQRITNPCYFRAASSREPVFFDIDVPMATPIATPMASHMPPEPNATATAVPMPAPSAIPSPICMDGLFIV
jgi:hypothetical protein